MVPGFIFELDLDNTKGGVVAHGKPLLEMLICPWGCLGSVLFLLSSEFAANVHPGEQTMKAQLLRVPVILSETESFLILILAWTNPSVPYIWRMNQQQEKTPGSACPFSLHHRSHLGTV